MKKQKIEAENFELTLTLQEFKKAKKFLKEYKVQENVKISFVVSHSNGIGKAISMKVEGIEKVFDITDYSSW